MRIDLTIHSKSNTVIINNVSGIYCTLETSSESNISGKSSACLYKQKSRLKMSSNFTRIKVQATFAVNDATCKKSRV